MDHDLFLAFLSEKGSGSWSDFKHAWAWLAGGEGDAAGKAWITAQALSSLGHIEVAWGDTIEWSAAPPVLTMIPRSGGRALLTGARTRHLYELPTEAGEEATGVLADAARSLELWVDTWPQRDSPTTVLVCCESHHDAERLASKLGIAYTYSAAHQLAGLLPALSAYKRLWEPGELPRGLDAEKFSTETLFWDDVEEVADFGLYRCRTYEKHVHALNGPTGWYRLPRELGQYEVLRWEGTQVMTYSRPKMQFTVRTGARLPPIHDRAVTLCSGRLPMRLHERAGHRLLYENVEERVAAAVASSLAQELVVESD